MDLDLLKHEIFESRFEGIFSSDYLTSHNAAKNAGYPSPIENLSTESLTEIYHGFIHRFR